VARNHARRSTAAARPAAQIKQIRSRGRAQAIAVFAAWRDALYSIVNRRSADGPAIPHRPSRATQAPACRRALFAPGRPL